MATNFTSVIGRVDENIEQRSSLVAALRAKLGDFAEPPLVGDAEGPAEPLEEDVAAEEPAPPVEITEQPEPTTVTLSPDGSGDSFTDVMNVMAQLDRGLDSRQKLIAALKSQLCKSAALPKTAPPGYHGGAPARPQVASAEAPPWGSRRSWQASTIPLAQPLSAAPTFGATPPPTASLPKSGSHGEPAAKRPRVVEMAPGFPAANGNPTQAAEDALAARKAEMLRSLQGAESSAGGPAQPPGAEGPMTTPPGGMPKAGGPPAGMRPPAPPAPPANATPEEFEAYRKLCWKQYYEYCAVYQKYYDQQKQGEKPEARAALSKARPGGPPPAQLQAPPAAALVVRPPPPVMAGQHYAGTMALPQQVPGKGVHVPATHAVARLPAAGKGRPPAPGLVEEDIHSKLLGL